MEAQYPPTTEAQYPPATEAQYPPATEAQYPPATEAQYPPATEAQYPPATETQYPPATEAQGLDSKLEFEAWGSDDDGWGKDELVDDFDGLRIGGGIKSNNNETSEKEIPRDANLPQGNNEILEDKVSLKSKPDEIQSSGSDETPKPELISNSDLEDQVPPVPSQETTFPKMETPAEAQENVMLSLNSVSKTASSESRVSSVSMPQPPPVSSNRPGGSIKSLRARKGSPFQPPVRKAPDAAVRQEQPSESVNILLQSSSNSVSKFCCSVNCLQTLMKENLQQRLRTLYPLLCLLFYLLMIKKQFYLLMIKKQFYLLMIKKKSEGKRFEVGDGVSSSNEALPPVAHHQNIPPHTKTPKVKSLASMPSTPQTPTVLDLTLQQPTCFTQKTFNPGFDDDDDSPIKDGSRCENEGESDGDSGGGVPRFSRMVPGCGSTTDPAAAPMKLSAAPPPPMPTDRVVTGIDNPIAPPALQATAPQIPANPANSSTNSAPPDERKALNPPKRSATIGSEESASVIQKTQSKVPSTPSSSSPVHLPPSMSSASQLGKQERKLSASTSSISPPQSPTFDDNPSSRRTKRDRKRDDYKTSGSRFYNAGEGSGSRHQQGYRDEMARYDNLEDELGSRPPRRSKFYEDDPFYNRWV